MMGAFDKKKRIIRWKEERESVCVGVCMYRKIQRVCVCECVHVR